MRLYIRYTGYYDTEDESIKDVDEAREEFEASGVSLNDIDWFDTEYDEIRFD